MESRSEDGWVSDSILRRFLTRELFALEARSLILGNEAIRRRFEQYQRCEFPENGWNLFDAKILGDDPYFCLGVWFHSTLRVRFSKFRTDDALNVVSVRIRVSGQKSTARPIVETAEVLEVYHDRETMFDDKTLRRVEAKLSLSDFYRLTEAFDEFLNQDSFCRLCAGKTLDDCYWGFKESLLNLLTPRSRLVQHNSDLKKDTALTDLCCLELARGQAIWSIRSTFKRLLPDEIVQLICDNGRFHPI